MTENDSAAEQGLDARLLAQVASGNLDALAQLFTRYQRQVLGLAQGITRSPETAEEVLQDVFYRLYTNAGRLDGSSPLLPWLYRVTANLSYNCARRKWRWVEPLSALTECLFAPVRRSPEHIAEQHELQAIVHKTLDELPPNHRSVLVLYYLNEYSIAEIAGILDLPEGTIKSRLHHARKLVKERLMRRFGEATALFDLI